LIYLIRARHFGQWPFRSRAKNLSIN
jgi:hypothetical protein